MHRQIIQKTLEHYAKTWAVGFGSSKPYAGYSQTEEQRSLDTIRDFVVKTPACFERSHPAGHLTGSALVISENFERVLLTLHRKLNIWLQLGGHADGHHLIHEVALREAEEESGLEPLQLLTYEYNSALGLPREPDAVPLPFDLDYHQIPARRDEPAHIHFDVRYLVVADDSRPLLISDESHDLKWFTLEEARLVTDERSMHRQFDKVAWLRTLVGP